MRVAMYYSNRDIRLEEMPKPLIGKGEMLVKIYASGICGSDVMEWYRRHKVPLILGHEIAGEVIETDAGLDDFKPGDRITATHHVPCFSCHYCLNGHETVCDLLLSGTSFDPGGFCEYVRLPAVNVERGTWKLPADTSYDAATFTEPLACVIRGQRQAGFSKGKSLLVLGSGISGLMHINLAAVSGAGLIVASDLNEYRLQAAKRFGADFAFRADEDIAARFREANNGLDADIVIVCASAESAFKQAMDAVERGGTILFFAPTMEGVTLPLSVNDLFWRRDITVTTTYAGSPDDCKRALEIIAEGRLKIKEMITHRFGLADAAEGFRLVAEAGESIKIIIRPQE